MPDWFMHFKDAVIITEKCGPTITIRDILDRMILTLSHPAHAKLEADIMACIENVTADNAAASAQWLLDIVSFPIEARWHAAESSLNHLIDNKAVNDKLFLLIRQYVFDSELDATHGTCWKIWAQLGVGPRTGYKLTDESPHLLLKPVTQAELKRLFAIVFENDRIVLDVLHDAVNILEFKA
jgi:hypothetical protein